MDRSVYIAMGGARDAMRLHATQAHNLANSQTVGFKADLTRAESLPLSGPGFQDRVHAAQTGEKMPDLSPGLINQTGRDLDIAIQGGGFLMVQGADGGEVYSRAGNLRVDTNGLLLDHAGRPVLGNSGPVSLPPYEKLEIGTDGSISIRGEGEAEGPLNIVDRLRLTRPDAQDLVKDADGTIRHRDGLASVPDASVVVASGALEASNVEPVGVLVQMIELQRQFEMHIKFIENSEENDRAASRLLRMR
ncbi:MAG: flagellar basal body rod protein FlgF [Pseudomonadota bacterium]